MWLTLAQAIVIADPAYESFTNASYERTVAEWAIRNTLVRTVDQGGRTVSDPVRIDVPE